MAHFACREGLYKVQAGQSRSVVEPQAGLVNSRQRAFKLGSQIATQGTLVVVFGQLLVCERKGAHTPQLGHSIAPQPLLFAHLDLLHQGTVELTRGGGQENLTLPPEGLGRIVVVSPLLCAT